MSTSAGVYKKRDADEDFRGSFKKSKDISDSGIELQNISTDPDENGIVNKGFQDDGYSSRKDDIDSTDAKTNLQNESYERMKTRDSQNVDFTDKKSESLTELGVIVSSKDQVNSSKEYLKDSSSGKDHETIHISGQDEDSEENSFIEKMMDKIKQPIENLYITIRPFVPFTLLVIYIVYLGFAIAHDWEKCENYCSGSKFITIISVLVFTGLFYFYVVKKYFANSIEKCCLPLIEITGRIATLRFFSGFMYLLLFGCMLAFVIIDSSENRERLISFAGLWVLLLLGYVFSKHPKKVIFRHVAWGIALQFIFGILILRWEVGKSIFKCLGDKVSLFLSYTDEGSSFVYGYLVTGKLQDGDIVINNATINHTDFQTIHNITGILTLPPQPGLFAFKVLSVIFFFSFFVSVLYYYGALQWVIVKLGWCLQATVGTTAAESVNASANIFLGQTEAPLIVRPFLHKMTKSELHAVMTGGFATIAGTVLAAYITFGVSASHLLSASVMSAPAALAYSKLFYPETEISRTNASDIKIEKPEEKNALEAASKGVINAIALVAGIIANLIAFIAFIYFVDQLVIFFGSLIGWEISMTYLMSKVFMPLAYMMGIRWDECDKVGELIGIKTILNEFIAFQKLGTMKGILSPRSQAITTYALCGFSNLSSIGIQLGGLGAMAPQRIPDLAKIAFRAMIAGSAACFMTACIAGALLKD